jgi:hypothetical protein
MKTRSKMSRSRSNKSFKRSAVGTHKANVRKAPMRGGIRF